MKIPWKFLLLIHHKECNHYVFKIFIQAKLCVDEKIPVVPIPGASAFVAALSASGLATDEFTFGNF